MTKKKRRTPANRRKTGGAVAIVEAGKATRFQPGQSGNLAGRPRNVISIEMKRMLGEMCPLRKDGSTWAQAIAQVVLSKALRGDIRYVEVVFDRVEGKAHQAISLSGAVEVNSQISIAETKERLEKLMAKIRYRQKSEKEAEEQKQSRTLPN
jgi:Family of unknown function (DUF5681)